jgi:surface carbohydrate biosynthesis protein
MPLRRVLFVVPYRARDLEGHALVGYHLKRRYEYEPVFSNGYDIERKLFEHKPDALVLDHLEWDFKARQARLAKELGIKVLVLATEGLHQNKEEAVRRAGKMHQVGGIVDGYFAWGRYVRDAILEQELVPTDRLFVTGCPRFDFYRQPYLSLMQPREQFLRELGFQKPHAPLVVWATNTTYAARNPKKIMHRQVTKARKPEEEVSAYLADHQTQFREHSRAVLELANRHQNWNFVIKVHPAEWINPYVEMVRNSPNIRLAYDKPIRDFLYHCDVLLQRDCTTATEAWMLAKPVIEMEIGNYYKSIREEYRRGNQVVTSLPEADDMLQRYVDGFPVSTVQQRAREEFIEEYYHRVDGMSSSRCAELIHEIVSPPNYTDEEQSRTRRATSEAYLKWSTSEDGRLPNRFKDILHIRRQTSLRFWKRMFRRERKDNMGLFTPEIEITTDMVKTLYRDFDRALLTAPAVLSGQSTDASFPTHESSAEVPLRPGVS